MRAKLTRRERAMMIRDHILPQMIRYGRSESSGGQQGLVLRTAGLTFSLSAHSGGFLVMDIWYRGKMMSIGWRGQEFKLVSFRSGDWERSVLALRRPVPTPELIALMNYGPRYGEPGFVSGGIIPDRLANLPLDAARRSIIRLLARRLH